MISIGIGLALLSLISGEALVISGGDLAHIDTASGTVTPSVGVLHTYPNDVVIHDGSAFVVNSGVDSGALQKFEMGSWALTELTIGSGWNCWASLPLSDGMIAVSATLNNSIEMVNPATMQIQQSIPGVASCPEWMATEGDLLYAACGGWGEDQSVVVVNTAAGTVINTLTAGVNCQSVAVYAGNLFVTCSGTYGSNQGHVVVIDPATGTATDTLFTGGFPGFSSTVNEILYTGDPWGAGVYSINMATLTVLHDSSNPFCTGGNGIAGDDQGNLWISDSMNNEVRVYDSSENLVHTYSVTAPGPLAVNGSFMGLSGDAVSNDPVISLLPNPALNTITVSGANPGSVVCIYDITGRLSRRVTTAADGSCSMNVTELEAGVYTAVSGRSTARFAVTAR